MGPNSGGGRKAGAAGAPNVATRARFSNWKPAVKAKNGNRPDDNDSTNSKKKVDMTKHGAVKGRVASSISVAATRASSSSAGLPDGIDINSLETLSVSRELLTKLFSYLNPSKSQSVHNDTINSSAGLSVTSQLNPKLASQSKSETDHSKRDSRTVDSDITELELKIANLKLLKSSTQKDINPTFIETEGQKKAAQYFLSIGFTSSEVFLINESLNNNYSKEIKGIKHSDINDSSYLLLLAEVSQQILPLTKEKSNTPKNYEIAERNTDLSDECDVLKSIYGASAIHRKVTLLGAVCNITDLSLNNTDLNIQTYKKSSFSTLVITFIVYRADLYPHAGSLAFGWVSSPSQAVSSDVCRKCSTEAMNLIHSLHTGVPCAFDFIQCIITSVIPQIEAANKAAIIAQEMEQVSSFYEKNNSNNIRLQIAERVMNGNLKIIDEKKVIDNDKVQVKETKKEGNIRRNNEITSKGSLSLSSQTLPVNSSDGPPVQRPVAVAPEVKFTDLPEYRSAYLQALNEGLAYYVLHVRRVLFTIKLLHKCFELLCSLLMPFGWIYVFYAEHLDKIMNPSSRL
jgi:hypothetical protein